MNQPLPFLWQTSTQTDVAVHHTHDRADVDLVLGGVTTASGLREERAEGRQSLHVAHLHRARLPSAQVTQQERRCGKLAPALCRSLAVRRIASPATARNPP